MLPDVGNASYHPYGTGDMQDLVSELRRIILSHTPVNSSRGLSLQKLQRPPGVEVGGVTLGVLVALIIERRVLVS